MPYTIMSTDTVCRVCLVNNINLNCVRNDLQDVYERLTGEEYNKVGYPVHMCNICLTVLRKCQRFMENARDTNNVLEQWYNKRIEMRVARPLYTYSISTAGSVSTYNESMTLKNDIKVENIESDQEDIQTEFNIDVDVEKTDMHEQTDYTELLADSANDNMYTDTVEDSADRQTDPLFDSKIETLALNLDDLTDTKTKINHEIISRQDNDAPPAKKRKTNEDKPQHQTPETSTVTAANSETSNDGILLNNTPSQLDNKSPQNIYFVRHMKTHTSDKPFPCSICKLKFSSKSNLVRHIRTHTNEKPLSCDMCDYKCNEKGCLQKHMRTHTGEKPFSCEICNYKFAQHCHLVRHMTIHTNEKPLSCYICGYKCNDRHYLQKHMRTHTSGKSLSCDICEYKFTQKYHLVRHMRTHTGEKPFSCEICDYTCKRKDHLVQHMRIHNGVKPFSCDICKNKFARKIMLQTHMKSHTGEKPFSCDICGYKYAVKAHLSRHIKTHNDKKQFSCHICRYKCDQKDVLTLHIRTHFEIKPFSCDICDYKCSQNSLLKRHLLRQHLNKKRKGKK